MDIIWLPILVPLIVMALLLAMDHLQERLLDEPAGGPVTASRAGPSSR